MRIRIIADQAQTERIQLSLNSLLSVSGTEKREFSQDPEADVTVVDIGMLKGRLAEDYGLSDGEKVLVHVRGVYLDPMDLDGIRTYEQRLIEAEDWTTLRTVNESLADLNCFFRHSELSAFPHYLQLEMTDRCNAECIMCAHRFQKNIGAKDLPPECFDAIRELLPFVRVAVLHGNGEPFLNPEIFNYLDEYMKYGISVTTSTNLSVFNERIAYYINHCFSDIRVSCDACTKEIYEGIRRNLSFERLKTNLRLLKQLCPDVRKIMTVVIMRQNIHQLQDIVRFAAEYGFETVIFSNMIPSMVLGNSEDAPLRYRAETKHHLRLAAEAAADCGVQIVYPDMYDTELFESDAFVDPLFPDPALVDEHAEELRRLYMRQTVPVEPLKNCTWDRDRIACRGVCDWCVEQTYIDVDGNVYVCCINSKYAIGNLREQSFAEIWNCSEMQKIRRSFYDGVLPDFCEGCHFIMHHSLKRLHHADESEAFKNRRCLSRIYQDGPVSEA